MDWIFNDGGRWDAGFRPRKTGDCATRAIAIATELPYRQVWEELEARQREYVMTSRARWARTAREIGGRKLELEISPDHGTHKVILNGFLRDQGWLWTPTMGIGTGARVHLRADELPLTGRLVVSLSRHWAAVVDGTVHDTYIDDRDGRRTVYGIHSKP